MPVRLLRRLTGTALWAAFRSRSAVDVRKAPASPNGHGLPAAFRSRSAVDARKAPSSPNGHGLRPPFGRPGAGGPAFSQRSAKGRFCHLSSPKPPIPSPARFYQETRADHALGLSQESGGRHVMCRRAEQWPPFVSSRARGCHAKAGFFGEVQTRTGDACGWRKISVGPECETGPGSAGTGKPAVGWRRIPPCFQGRTRTARWASSGGTDCRSIPGSARSCGCGRGDLTAAVGYAVSSARQRVRIRQDGGCVGIRRLRRNAGCFRLPG